VDEKSSAAPKTREIHTTFFLVFGATSHTSGKVALPEQAHAGNTQGG